MSTTPFVPSDDEETETGEEVAPDAEREDLIKAGEAVLKEKGVSLEDGTKKAPKAEIEAERDEKGRFLKPPKPVEKQDKPKDGKPEPPSSIIARELAKREARREEEGAAKAKMAEADAILQKAQAAMSSLEAREKAAAEKERELNEIIAAAQRDPMAVMKRMGWTADQFINNAQRANDPAYQEAIALREELSKRDRVIEELRTGVDELRQARKQYDEMGQKQQAQVELQEFWDSIPKDSPVFKDYDDQDFIVYAARKVRQKYFNETGKVASPKQVGEYLHYRALQKRSVVPDESAGRIPNAGKSKAKVPRAIGGSEASERRSSNGTKHIHDMTPEEEREYLADVAAAAVAGSAD